MKIILQNVRNGKISVEEVPGPTLQKGHLLVRNHYSLISAGTEKSLMQFSGSNYLQKARMRPDLVRRVIDKAMNEGLWQTYRSVHEKLDQKIPLGYSSSGIVEAVGEGITDIKPGDRVACAGMGCASHAELISVPRNLASKVPDDVSMETACYVTLGAIAMQGVRLAEPGLSDIVVVYGLGLVGMLSAQLAKAAGCRVIGADINQARIKQAQECGIEAYAIDDAFVGNILQHSGGYGADRVLLCAATKSNSPIEMIPMILRQKGMLVVVGDVSMNIPRRDYYAKEIDIRVSRSYGPGRYDPTYEEGGMDYPYAYVRWTENRNMESFLDLASRNALSVERITTHHFDIDQALDAYRLLDHSEQNQHPLGIVVRYPHDQPSESLRQQSISIASRPPESRIRLGVIGAGSFARTVLLPAFSEIDSCHMEAVNSANGLSAKETAQKFKATTAVADADDIFNNPDINAVVIATRHDSHAKYVIKALQAGKAVFVEKPLGITEDELSQVAKAYSLAAESGSPLLMVGYNRRFSPLLMPLKEKLDAIASPKTMVYRVNAGQLPADSWIHDPQIGGGRLIGEACHFIDTMAWLCGSTIVSVSASALDSQTQGITDSMTLTITFEDGSIGSLHYVTTGHPSLAKEYFEVHAAGTSALNTNFKKLTVHGFKELSSNSQRVQQKGHLQEVESFCQCLTDGTPSPISFEELIMVSKATFAAEKALRTGQAESIS